MNKSNFAALGFTLAVALSTGGLLLKHPVPTGSNLAPGAYSDILIAEDAAPREATAGEKSATPTDIPGSSGKNPKMGDAAGEGRKAPAGEKTAIPTDTPQ